MLAITQAPAISSKVIFFSTFTVAKVNGFRFAASYVGKKEKDKRKGFHLRDGVRFYKKIRDYFLSAPRLIRSNLTYFVREKLRVNQLFNVKNDIYLRSIFRV